MNVELTKPFMGLTEREKSLKVNKNIMTDTNIQKQTDKQLKCFKKKGQKSIFLITETAR